jgi:hypothetical protein
MQTTATEQAALFAAVCTPGDIRLTKDEVTLIASSLRYYMHHQQELADTDPAWKDYHKFLSRRIVNLLDVINPKHPRSIS